MVRRNFCNVLFVFAISTLMVSCTSERVTLMATQGESTLIPTLAKMSLPTLLPRPNYIQVVGPEEYTVVPIALYNYFPVGVVGHGIDSSGSLEQGFQSSICVRPLLEPLVQKGDDFDEQEIWDRMELLADGEVMNAYLQVFSRGLPAIPKPESPLGSDTRWIEGGDYCWYAPLGIGHHEVIFRFRQTSGDVQEYIWYFEIGE